MKKKILLLITLMAVMVLAVNTRQKNDIVAVGTNETPQHSFLTMTQTKDATVAQQMADSIMAMVKSGEYDYICVEQPAVEWMFVDQYAKGSPRLNSLLDFHVYFKGVHYKSGERVSSMDRYNDVMGMVLRELRTYNRTAQRPVSVMGLDYVTESEVTFPINRRIIAFNKATVTDSLMAMSNRDWGKEHVAGNTVHMMEKDKAHQTELLGDFYYIQWQHYFQRMKQYREVDLSAQPREKDKLICEDFLYLNTKFTGRKIVIGCEHLIQMLSNTHKNTALCITTTNF